jgi:chemotaxis protein CheX
MPQQASARLSLPQALDVQTAQPLIDQLCALRGAALTLDASQVRRLGGLGLQVLLSARASWAADGESLDIDSPSEAFEEAWTLYGAPTPASGRS